MNTAMYSPSGAYSGIGFAIPVDEVNRVVPQLIRYGKIVRPGMGVQVSLEQVTKQLGLNCVLIMGVKPDSPAAKAGLRGTRRDESGHIQVGDVITAIDGEKIESVNQLLDRLEKFKIGSTVEVMYHRDGKDNKTNLKLESID